MSALLTPELLRRLEQFQLLAARRAKSSARGERRSKARGQSVEFADHRNYSHGDDFRYIDWNLYGRLDKLFVKLYEEERELPVRIFLDASESMTFGEPRKFDFARQIAAAIGYVALCGFDRVSIIPFPDLTPLPETSSEQAMRGALRSVRGKKSSMQFFQNPGFIRHFRGLHGIPSQSQITNLITKLSTNQSTNQSTNLITNLNTTAATPSTFLDLLTNPSSTANHNQPNNIKSVH